jgi:hypothetical protein
LAMGSISSILITTRFSRVSTPARANCFSSFPRSTENR